MTQPPANAVPLFPDGRQSAGLALGGAPLATLTFLFTDVEGSTRLLERNPKAYRDAVAKHHALLREAVEQHRGQIFETIGDAVYAVFDAASDAIGAAACAQLALQHEDWEEIDALNVRMALHTGEVERQGDHFFGVPLYQCARLMNVAHGGQVVVSGATSALVCGLLQGGVELHDLGEHRLKDLLRPERIFQLKAPGLRLDFPPLRTVAAGRHNLPLQLTAFVGRQKEIAHACDILSESETRLLTLTGPGGVGKTRLSLQVAEEFLDEYSDGVFFVELQHVSTADLVMTKVASTLGLLETAKRPVGEILQDYLRERQMLLVLDNFEHVVAAAPRLAALLAACPRLKILVSSRVVLHIAGERQLAVPPLELPDPNVSLSMTNVISCDAIQLFVERARRVKPTFEMSAIDAAAVAQICRRVDGLPLAIELAAARVKIFSTSALLARMSKPLEMLSGGPCDLPTRQKTMRQAIAWSYDLLDDEEKSLLRRLAVFVGGAPLGGVEAVIGEADDQKGADTLGGLASLLDKSLLRRDETNEEDEPRFTMLETIREFALERLIESGEAPTFYRRHADYYRILAQRAERGLTGRQQATWLRRLQKEVDNIWGALTWLIERRAADDGLSLAAPLSRFWRAHGFITEARSRLATLLSMPDISNEKARAKALHAAGWLAREQADYVEARSLDEQSLELYRKLKEPYGIGWALIDLAFVARYEADYPRARKFLDESLPLVREVQDLEGTAVALASLGLIARDEGDAATAEAYLQDSLAVWQELGDPIGTGWTLTSLGIVARADGRRDAARTRLERALALWREIGDRQNAANVLGTLATLERDNHNCERAAALLCESLTLLKQVGDRRAIAFVLEGFASLAAAQGNARRAVKIAAAARTARERIGAPAPPGWRMELEKTLAEAGSALTSECVADMTREGAAMNLAEAIEFALD
jgi:predicted ATPase/class 3 adenylate cyclase